MGVSGGVGRQRAGCSLIFTTVCCSCNEMLSSQVVPKLAATCIYRPPLDDDVKYQPPDKPNKLRNSFPSPPHFSANILLDHHLEAKIGDFGLAREFPQEKHTSLTVTRVHGTRPYLPDEYLRSRKLSEKVDTFSFGVVSWGRVVKWDCVHEMLRHNWFISRECAHLRF